MNKPMPREWATYALRFMGMLIILGLLLFLPAGTLRYWGGWILLAVYGLLAMGFLLYGLLYDPDLLRERSHKAANVKRWDTIILNIYAVFLVMTVALSALDGGRLHLSKVPFWVQMVGLALMILSFGLLFWVTKTNTFLSRRVRIQDDRGHRVITTGPYAYVRHPMYATSLVFFPAIPMLLASWWGLLPAMVMIVLFVMRTILEDKTLQRELPGYAEYATKTRFKLIPGVW